jgi:eukaryotic-like serine/threonine-protein kinase
MTPEQWSKVREVLATALELPPADRQPYLNRNCADDDELRREVQILLVHEDATGSRFLSETSFVQAVAASIPQERNPWIGRRVGAYQILEQIGAGGMGEVYRAFRADDQYRQEVALKLIRAGQDSVSVISRFRNERQILASLEHPNIARLLDGGTTQEGLPYLVMELIDGKPIGNYCDENKLSVPDRLKLFLQVCTAVQHAHQRLVIHRDIKPSNILVTTDGTPKLLDFGIAKVLSADSQAQPEQTRTAFRVLTPEYASPEQINGDAITTGSDVYSLGVVLYDLLTGHSPYPEAMRRPQDLVTTICTREPDKPSARVKNINGAGTRETEQIAAARGSTPEKLQKQLRGDLDNIVLKALRKEPSQRYSSGEQLSEDVRRYLEHIPVMATGNTWTYRGAKFIRRNRFGVLTACLILTLVAVSMAAILRAERKARAEQVRAERRFNEVRKLANTLMFEIHDSVAKLPGATDSRRLIVESAQQYLDSLAADSGSGPTLLRELADAYTRLANVLGEVNGANLGDSQSALKDYYRAAQLREAVAAALPRDRDVRRELAESYMSIAKQRSPDRQKFFDKAADLLNTLSAQYPQDLKIKFAVGQLTELKGGIYADSGKLNEALSNYQDSLRIFEGLAQTDPNNRVFQAELAIVHKHVGATLIMFKQFSGALEHYRSALVIDEKVLGEDPSNVSARYAITYTYSDTGYILRAQGDLSGALNYYEKALAIRQALADADPKDVRARTGLAKTYSYIAGILRDQKQFQAAAHNDQIALAIRGDLLHSDPTNDYKRFEVARSQAFVAIDYWNIVASLHENEPRRQTLCRQATSLLQQALPVYHERKDRLVGAELGQLSEAEGVASHCGHILSNLHGIAKN